VSTYETALPAAAARDQARALFGQTMGLVAITEARRPTGLPPSRTGYASDGFWAPDGAYADISQLVTIVWIAVLSGFLAMRYSAAQAPERAAVPAA
jgi:hypothetical protein